MPRHGWLAHRKFLSQKSEATIENPKTFWKPRTLSQKILQAMESYGYDPSVHKNNGSEVVWWGAAGHALLMCCMSRHGSQATIVESLKNWRSHFHSTLGSRQSWKGHWLSEGLVAVADRHLRFKWCASKLPDTMFSRMCRLSVSCQPTSAIWVPILVWWTSTKQWEIARVQH